MAEAARISGGRRSRPPGKGPGLRQGFGASAQEDAQVRALARVDGDIDAGAKSPDMGVG